MIAQLIKTALDILRLRAGPQDLPAGAQPLQLAVVLFLLSYIVAVSAFFPLAESLLRALLDLGLSAIFVHLLLRIRGMPQRFGQTFGAICITGFVLNILAWPLFVTLAGRLPSEGGAEMQSGEGNEILALMFWLLYGWSLVVSAHIYRHALEIWFAAGFLLALTYFILAYTVGEALLGTAQ